MIKNIGGALFRKMVTAGAKNLELHRERVDALNVFPVPDGDTGTNMSLTYQAAVKELSACSSNNFSELAECFSKGALRGARGNSGVILSQIFRGLCSVFKDASEIDTKIFAKALKSGAEVAYSAVTKPKEGTMLTVIRGIAEYANSDAKKCSSLEAFFEKIIAEGESVLNKTPDMLEVLKKAGVVDAGGMGVVIIFKGMLKGLLGEEIEVTMATSMEEHKPSVTDHADISDLGDIEFAYCTEFFVVNLMKKTTIADIDRLRERLDDLGDSVIVIGDLEMIKVHVHTNKPGVALQYALELGELDRLKIENMLEQNRALIQKMESERREMGMLAICAGDGLASIFKDLLVDRVIEGGQTMNPSAEDIANAVKRINAENVFVFPNNKNIILAAEQSKALVENKKIHVIPSKSIPQGITAVLSFDPELSVEENKVNMAQSLENVITGQVTYAVRSTQMNGLDLKEGDIIGLNSKKVLCKGNSIKDVTIDLVAHLRQDTSEIVTLYYGSDITEAAAHELVAEIAEKYPKLDVDAHYGGQPIYYYFVSVE